MDSKDPMNMFSSRRTAKIEQPKVSEQSEQLAFCRWLKHNYPTVLFRSDIYAGMQRTPMMQNIKNILDPYSGWPDVEIYWPDIPNRVGIMIEMKSLTGKAQPHQIEMHKRLEALGWDVHICQGAEAAKKIFLQYVK